MKQKLTDESDQKIKEPILTDNSKKESLARLVPILGSIKLIRGYL